MSQRPAPAAPSGRHGWPGDLQAGDIRVLVAGFCVGRSCLQLSRIVSFRDCSQGRECGDESTEFLLPQLLSSESVSPAIAVVP